LPLPKPGNARPQGGFETSPAALRRSPLPGNVHPLARAEFDQGKVSDSMPLEHIIMMLKRSPEQELAT
jgi:hypothetical protein